MKVRFSVFRVQPGFKNACCVSELNPHDSDCLIIHRCWKILQLRCFCCCLCHTFTFKTASAKVTMHHLQLEPMLNYDMTLLLLLAHMLMVSRVV